jgi:hypothetical protein
VEGASVTAIYALYRGPEEVQQAVDSLRAAGVRDRDIIVISSEPIEEYEFSHRDKATWMYFIAGVGGAVGLAFATWLAWFTQIAWPLPTGNMPIVSWWANLIPMFELTMLGGIVATVITLLITARIPSRQPKLYDPEVSDGKILVGVEDPAPGSVNGIERALLNGGAARVKTM